MTILQKINEHIASYMSYTHPIHWTSFVVKNMGATIKLKQCKGRERVEVELTCTNRLAKKDLDKALSDMQANEDDGSEYYYYISIECNWVWKRSFSFRPSNYYKDEPTDDNGFINVEKGDHVLHEYNCLDLQICPFTGDHVDY